MAAKYEGLGLVVVDALCLILGDGRLDRLCGLHCPEAAVLCVAVWFVYLLFSSGLFLVLRC